MLALSLVVLFLSVQSMPIDNNIECYTDNKIIKQNTEKFYCTAVMMYDQLQEVRQILYVSIVWYVRVFKCTYIFVCMHMYIHVCTAHM